MNTNGDIHAIPLPTIRRFPAYLRLLKDHCALGEKWISATALAEELKLKPIQVRKDMACTGVEGKPKVGFQVAQLIRAIEHHLGWDNTTDAILVGAGNLGTALMGYKGFESYGLRIIAVFDADPKKHGKDIHGIHVSPMESMSKLINRLGINIAVLSVPGEFAQQVAEQLVKAGIRGIWNFAPKSLNLPEHIIIQKTDLATSFAELSSRLRQEIERRGEVTPPPGPAVTCDA